MHHKKFPVIDPVATGKNILRLRTERGLSVRELQEYFGFEEPQAIYKWQKGKSLPSVDNLYALGALLEVPMDEILVSARPELHKIVCEQQAEACCSPRFWADAVQWLWMRQRQKSIRTLSRNGGCGLPKDRLLSRHCGMRRPIWAACANLIRPTGRRAGWRGVVAGCNGASAQRVECRCAAC